jgi:tetratricopeptide (TPR) repeat protein
MSTQSEEGVGSAMSQVDAVAAAWEAALELGRAGRNEEQLAAYEDLIGRFGDDPDPVVRGKAARASLFRAIVLRDTDRVADALAAYDDLLSRFGADPDPGIHLTVVEAGVGRAGALVQPDEKLAAYDDLLRKVGGSEEPAIRELEIIVLVNRAKVLADLGRMDEALDEYDELLRQYGDDQGSQELRARLLYSRAMSLVHSGRLEDGLRAYQDLVSLYLEATEPGVRLPAAKALFNSGPLLARLGRTEEAASTFRTLLELFGNEEDSELQEIAETARQNRDVFGLGIAGVSQPLWREAPPNVLRRARPRRLGVGRGRPTDDPVELVLRAGQLADSGKAAEAEEAYRAALETASDVARQAASNALGLIARDRGDDLEAERLFRAADSPPDGEVRDVAAVNLAQQLAEMGRTEEAEARLVELARSESDLTVVRAIAAFGYVLHRSGRFDESASLFPASWDGEDERLVGPALSRFAHQCIEDERFAAAIEAAKRGLDRLVAPADVGGARLRLAIAYQGAGRYAEAQVEAERLLREGPAHLAANALLMKGNHLLADGRVSEAVEALRQALDLSSDPATTAEAKSCLGIGLWEHGEVSEAETLLSEAASSGEGAIAHVAAIRLGSLALQRGDFERAEQLFRRVMAEADGRQHGLAAGNLAVLYVIQGRLDEAAEAIASAGETAEVGAVELLEIARVVVDAAIADDEPDPVVLQRLLGSQDSRIRMLAAMLLEEDEDAEVE